MTRRRLALGFIALAACAPTERKAEPARRGPDLHPSPEVRAAGAAGGSNAMPAMSCDAARRAIETHQFVGWHGLPAGCTPESLFGIPYDDTWGMQSLGARFARARSRVLELAGYYRPMAYVRDGQVVLFDGMNPTLDGGWAPLSADLGPPEATFDWVLGTTPMPAGERVHAARGITIYLNPANDKVAFVSVYPPTTVDEYAQRLRLGREKRIDAPR